MMVKSKGSKEIYIFTCMEEDNTMKEPNVTTVTEAKENELDLEPVSMYQLFARMFAHIAKSVVSRYGSEGEQAIREGVRSFGEERGRNIAARAKAAGKTNDVQSYLSSYDMARSGEFVCENTYGENQTEQLFTKCVFADEFKRGGNEAYGLMYCEEIDPAIAHGYNENMECVHGKHIFKEGVCTFCFKMRE